MTQLLAAPPSEPQVAAPLARRLRPPVRPGSVATGAVMITLIAAGLWSATDLRITVATFIDGAARADSFLSRTLPLDFPPVAEIAALVGQTMSIVIIATLLSVVLSIPVAFAAAGTTATGRGSRFAARALIVVARAIPDVVLAIVFVRIFGIGALTGVLAMGLHSIGMIGKLYADAIEQIDPGPPTALRAAGATRWQRLVGAVVPPVLPAFVAVGLHRLDINLRISVVLGFVGVEGIGYAIAESLTVLDYRRGLALAVVVVGLCIAVELLSGALRGALLGRPVTTSGPVGWSRGLLARVGRSSAPRPSTPTTTTNERVRLTPPWTPTRVLHTIGGVLSVAVIVASAVGTGIDPVEVAGAVPGMLAGFALFWPPETGGILTSLLAQLAVTVQIALAGLLIGVVISLPLGSLAARNVAPHPALAQLSRMIILGIRGIPELILAIIFVVMTGLGEVAGAVALGVGGVGLLGKLAADSLEEVPPGPAEALRATGATRWQVFVGAILPAGAKAMVGHSLYLFDSNIRSATLLGIVGAGGIGFSLLNAARVLEFGVVTTIVLLIFGAVMLVELLAIWLRSRL